MFTVGAFVLVILLAWYAGRKNEQDRLSYDRAPPEDRMWELVLHIRQDLKLVAFLLGAVVVMLGIVADRL